MIKRINIFTIIAFVGVSFAVSACGIRGDLDTAPPMWGKDRQEYKAHKKAEAQKAQHEQTTNSTNNQPDTE